METSIAKDLPVKADENALREIVFNLMANAIEASTGLEKGKVIISAESVADDPQVDELTMLELRIKDTGQGIREDIKHRIFEPFFTTKEIGEGTGLGLSISYGIIENHHGSIEVESQQGKGTEFIIRLPRTQMDKT